MSAGLQGGLDRVDADGVIEGWCWSDATPALRRAVEIRMDGAVVARATCAGARPDLADRGIGDGAHGFLLVLPPEIRRPGIAVTIALHDQASGALVAGPACITWRAAEPGASSALEGNLDGVTPDGLVSGWCWYPARPDLRATVSVLIDGEVAGCANATQFRPDLARAGIGDGRHGFSFALPWQALDAKGALLVAVRDAGSGAPLGSPALLRLGPLSAAEQRVTAMERQLRALRAELAHLSAELDRRDAQSPTQDLFATLGALFSGMAATGLAAPDFSLRQAVTSLQTRFAVLTLAVAHRPRALIAVPANADFAEIHGCLAAMQAAGLDRSCDIVLLDQGHGPPELALLPQLVRNLRVLRSEAATPGLSLAALAAADDDRFLVWLDPRLRVPPGWLESLLDTCAWEPEAALVAGRVVGQDGLLREAGWVAGADGTLAPLGRLDDAEKPEFGFCRPVDAVASLGFALRPAALRGVSGDLCAGLRAAERRILLQPRATASCHDAADLDHADPETMAPPAAHRFAGHALVIDTTLPHPDHDSGGLATFEQLQVLRRLGWRVTFAATAGFEPHDPAALRLEAHGIELVRRPASTSATAYLLRHGPALDMVQVWRHANARPFLDRVRALAPRARLIFAPADLHHLREARRTGALDAELRSHELACVHGYDATLVHSDAEIDLLRPEIGDRRLRLMRWIARPRASTRGFAERCGIGFVASFDHSPNEDGLRWLLAEIMPILAHDRPGLHLHVVGQGLPADLAALAGPGLTVHGWVEDLEALFAGLRLSVAPLRYGAGFKGKVATSLSFGVPVVATAIAAEGTGLAQGDGIAIADHAPDLAAAIIRLHDDAALWQAQSARALERCRALYAPDAAMAVYASLLASLDLPRSVA